MLNFGVFDSFLITKAIQDWGEFYRIHGKAIGSSFTWRTQPLELYSPLPKANHECKEKKQREKSNMKNSRGQQLLDTFRELHGVHFMHTIFHFEAWEVRNPTLQTVSELALKWRSYSHWKTITPSWRPISQLRNHKVLAAKLAFGCKMETFSLRNFVAHLACLRNPPECFQIFVTDSFRFFSSDICCLNPHSLLVIHQS